MEELTTGPIPVSKVLLGAENAKLVEVFILGYEPSGEIYLAASTQDSDILTDLLIEARELVDELERQEQDDSDEDEEDLD
jgi:hypothetical protein